MAKRKAPTINSSSTADLAFMLLFFFLVTTTMDVDRGILRQLPPIAEGKQNTDVEIKDRNLLQVKINQFDRLLVRGKPLHIERLKDIAKEFIKSDKNRDDLPELDVKEINGIRQPVMVSKGVISLQNDRGTSYNSYIKVQDILVSAYNELRDDAAFQYFGRRSFNDLNPAQQDAVTELFPQRISEAEPKNIGGK